MKKQFINFRFLPFLSTFILAMSLAACGDDDSDVDSSNDAYIEDADCTGNEPTYTADIAAILDANCATSGCHNNASEANNLTLEGFDNAKAAFNDFDMLCAIHHGDGCAPMPQGGNKLQDADIDAITCWAKNEFPE